MALSLKKLAAANTFSLKTKNLGELRIGSMTIRHLIELEELVIKEKVDGLSFSKELLLLTGYKHTTADNKNPLDDEPESLSKADFELIDDEDIEHFAQEFLAHNPKFSNIHHETENELEQSKKIERNINEENTAYLLRVFKIYLENQRNQLESITGSIPNYFKDSYKTTDSIRNLMGKSIYKDNTINLLRLNSNLSEKLQESILGFNKNDIKVSDLSILGSQPTFESFKPPENPIYETNKRLNTLIGGIESMKPLVSDSAGLIKSMNDTAIKMQADFISSSSSNQRYAKGAIVIAVVSLLITSLFSWLGYKESKEQGENTEKVKEMMEIYQQDMLKQNIKFEDMLRIYTINNVETETKRKAQHNELVQTLKENAKNKSN